jgi:hypothetical protein
MSGIQDDKIFFEKMGVSSMECWGIKPMYMFISKTIAKNNRCFKHNIGNYSRQENDICEDEQRKFDKGGNISLYCGIE